MRLTFPTKAAAQAVADRIWNDRVRKGLPEPGSTAWAKPYQDVDKNGVPINSLWHIPVDTRARGSMTKEEVDKFPEWKTKELV